MAALDDLVAVLEERARLAAWQLQRILAGQRELKSVFEAHVKDKHSWRADGNETAAMRLREMMKDFE